MTGYISFLGSAWRHRTVLRGLVAREFKTRYAASAFGLTWALFQPLAAIAIYTVVFSVVFRASVPAAYKPVPFVIFLMCAYVPYQLFGDTVVRSSTVLLENISMIKKMAFPSELFVLAIFISNLITAGISLLLTFALMMMFGHFPDPRSLWLIAVFLIPLVLLCVGTGWLVSCSAVLFRDLAHIIPIVVQMLFFASPVFYSFEMLNTVAKEYEGLAVLARLNPMYAVIVGHRISIIGNEFVLEAYSFISMLVVSLLVFIGGAALFRVFKRELADHV